MPSASRYNKLITLERVSREHTFSGSTEAWELVRNFQGSCEYATQRTFREDGMSMEVDTSWVIRTRNKVIGITRDVGKFRYKTRVDGNLSIFYPKEFPVFKGNEWSVKCSDEEDAAEIDAGNLLGETLTGVY